MDEARQKGRSRTLKMLLGLLVSVVCLGGVFWSVESEGIFTTVQQLRWQYLVGAVLATALSYVLRAARWPTFFKFSPPRFRDSYRCLILGFFMNNVLPARIGEIVRAHLGGRATHQSRTYVLATIAAERLVDGLTISVLFVVLFTYWATPSEHAHGEEIFLVAYLFGLATLLTALTLILRKRLFSLLEKLGKIVPGHLSGYTLTRVRRFIEGLEPLFDLRRLIPITVWSLSIWFVELSVYWLVANAYGQSLSLGALGLFLAAVNFSSLIPAAPGGIGVIEAFATFALVQIGIQRETALVMVATQHLIQIGVIAVPGLLYLLLGIGERLTPQGDEDEEEELEPVKFADVSEIHSPSTSSTASKNALVSTGSDEIELSIVLPAYNEENRLPKTLLSIVEYFQDQSIRHEIIVVDDGSTDETAKVVHGFERLSSNVRLLRYDRNRGKGYAVRTGMLSAKGRYALYNDADGATPIAEIERLLEAVKAGAEIVIGSRAMYSRETAVTTVWYRKFMGRVFNATVNFLILPGIADTQCGFKLFSRDTAQYVFSRQSAERFSFDVEVLFIARKAGFRIVEVPINWVNVPGSKVDLVRDSIAMLLDVIRFRFRDLRGGYRLPRQEESAAMR